MTSRVMSGFWTSMATTVTACRDGRLTPVGTVCPDGYPVEDHAAVHWDSRVKLLDQRLTLYLVKKSDRTAGRVPHTVRRGAPAVKFLQHRKRDEDRVVAREVLKWVQGGIRECSCRRRTSCVRVLRPNLSSGPPESGARDAERRPHRRPEHSSIRSLPCNVCVNSSRQGHRSPRTAPGS
jgi:hypothetical protein